MAQKVHIVLVDDIDGSEADTTIRFALDGTSYEIDLNDANAAKLRDSLAPYIGNARRVSSAGRRGGRRGSRSRGADDLGPSPSDLRDWARQNGYEVSERGRVSSEIREAYEAAH